MPRTFRSSALRSVLRGFTASGLLLLWSGCADEEPPTSLSATCSLDSECTDPLICVFARCHEACRATRDCPTGTRCMRGETAPYFVCQLSDEISCERNSDCQGQQVCAKDGQCRDQCFTERDCPTEQRCLDSVCVDESDLQGGVLPATIEPGLGTPCVLATDCPEELVCLSTRVCGPECLTDKDCLRTWSCRPQGANGYGRCFPNSFTPEPEPPQPELMQLHEPTLGVGATHTCFVQAPNEVRCWGDNRSGELGLGDNWSRGINSYDMGERLPNVQLGMRTQAITVGNGASCALSEDGRVKCWGRNDFGQLGLGDSRPRGGALYTDNGEPTDAGPMGAGLPYVDLGTGRTARAIVSGVKHVCALLDDYSVKCWGDNAKGALGTGDTVSRGGKPTQMGDKLLAVALGEPANSIAAGDGSSCAVLASGTVKCWGDNAGYRLGIPGTEAPILTPTVVDVGTLAASVSARGNGYCVVTGNRRIKCWGSSDNGALGLGERTPRGQTAAQMGAALPFVDLGPIPIAGEAGTRGLASARDSVCALTTSNAIKCWGDNSLLQLGAAGPSRGDDPGEMGDALPRVILDTEPVQVRGITSSPGSDTFCALTEEGAVKCWGNDSGEGNLGLGDNQFRYGEPFSTGTRDGDLPYVHLEPFAGELVDVLD